MWNIKWLKGCGENCVTLFCCRAFARCCAPRSPILLELMSNVASVYVKYWVTGRMRREWCYFILLQSICEMLCSLFTDTVVPDVQCGECLCEILSDWKNAERMVLLYFVVEHWRDIVLLVHRYCYHRCPMWWVSMRNLEWLEGCGENGVTLLCCRALARYCVPSSPILLELMFSVLSVYVKSRVTERMRREWCYFILLQNICEMLCSFFTDTVGTDVQCGECLCKVMNKWEN
jgi:hypothetical protein